MEGPRDPDLAALQLALKRLQTAPAVCRGPRHRCDGGRGLEWGFPGRGRCTVSTALIQSACKQTHLTPVIGGRSEDFSQEGWGVDHIRKCSPRSKIYTLKSLIMWHGGTLDAFFFALAGRDEPHGQRQKIQLISHIHWHNVAFDWGGELETAQTALLERKGLWFCWQLS